jgi:hypothetical protein
MAQPVIQTSFNAGEWAPQLGARVDLAKYHSGAALIRNFFVDYRGGATTRPGTRFVAKSQNNGSGPPRLIPFQASFTVAYILEFGVFNGAGYVAFYNNGAQVLLSGSPYTIASPYTSVELSQIKFAQNVNQLIICHPNHPPYVLTLISATNWTLVPITFGATISAPGGITAASTAPGGTQCVAYVLTSVDANGQESDPTAQVPFANRTYFGNNYTNTINIASVAGAVSYNVYKSLISLTNTVAAGAQYGFAGNFTGTTFNDTNINPDFSLGPPIPQNPFSGTGVQSVTITNPGNFTNVTVPTPTFTGGGGSGAAAIAYCQLTAVSIAVASTGWNVGDTILLAGGATLQVTSVTGFGGTLAGVVIIAAGSLASGNGQTISPTGFFSTSGHGDGSARFNVTWTLASIAMTSPGTGYATPPTVGGLSGGGGAATAVLGAPSAGNPSVPGFQDQRLCLAAPVQSVQQMNFSQPGSPFNFDTTSPTQADNAIQGTLVSGVLSTLQWLVPQPQGLIVLADKLSWIVNGGSAGVPISALNLGSRPQSYNGAAGVCPPIVANDNILYLQAKGSIVRDLVFNFYTQVFTGTDISILSSHLFYGFQLLEWAWAEEPFKVVWAVRNDGQLLSLTFLKEQEMIAWAHSDTQGAFKSIATVTETTAIGAVDAIYHCTQRNINGSSVYYIERFVELTYPSGYKSSWQVDAGIGYNGAPATSFSGAQHLAGAIVTGVADGVVINFTMPVSGTFVFGVGGTTGLTGIPNASIVTVGLAFLPQIQTLALDLGEPTVQGKRKKVAAVTARVKDALGLSAGRTFATALPMKDLILGNIGTMSNALVAGLQTTDARIVVDPQWDVFGQYCIQQLNPYPASVLGIIPEIEVGDTAK